MPMVMIGHGLMLVFFDQLGGVLMSADLIGLPAKSVPLATDLVGLKPANQNEGVSWIPYPVFVGAGFVSAALALDATTGHQYLPTCAGTPTGIPTPRTGRVGIVYDTTGNKLWVYNGAWRSIDSVLPGG